VMQKRRHTEKLSLLCNGPAKLTEALAITRLFNGVPLFDGPLQIWSPESLCSASLSETAEIVETTRIGIRKAKELPLRFYLKGSGSVSRK